MTQTTVRGMVALLAATVACAGPRAAPEAAPPYEPSERASRPHYASTVAMIAVTAGMPSLSTVSLPPGHRELRLHTGFGIVGPMYLLRIIETPEETFGWLHEWVGGDLDPDLLAEFGLEGDCRVRSDSTYYEPMRVCPVTISESIDWSAVMAEAEQNGAFDLPDISCDRIGHDGYHIVVENLDGEMYHTFEQGWCERSPAEQEAIRRLKQLPGTMRYGALEFDGVVIARAGRGTINDGTPFHVRVDEGDDCGIVFGTDRNTEFWRQTNNGGLDRTVADSIPIGARVEVSARSVVGSCPGRSYATAITVYSETP